MKSKLMAALMTGALGFVPAAGLAQAKTEKVDCAAVEKKAALSVPDATALLTQLHAPWGTLAPDTAEARRQLLHQMDAQLRKRLNEHDYDWYRTVLTEHLETVLLNRRR